MSETPRWSHSRLAMIERCGEQYRRRYVELEIIPPDLGLIRGRATHGGIHANVAHRIEEGEYLELEAVAQAASDSLDGELQGEFTLGADYEELGLQKAKGFVLDEVIGLTTLHALRVAPKIEPTASELRFEIPSSDMLPVVLTGVIDILDGADQKERIRDSKTTRKSPNAGAAQESTQLSMYELGYRALRGRPSDGQVLDYLVRTPKKGELKYVPLETQRGEQDLVSLIHRIERAQTAADAGIFVPAPESAWWCDAKWCGYARTCPFYRGRPRPKN